MQNDFADPAGGLYVRGGEDVVPLVSLEVGAAQNAGAAIVYTQDWHPQDTPHFEKDGGIWPVHCVAGTWGAELHPSLHRARPDRAQGHRRARTATPASRCATPCPAPRRRPSCSRCSTRRWDGW